MKSYPSRRKAKDSTRPVPDAEIVPFGTGIVTVGTVCVPNGDIWSNPIMPDGFITYTDFMPSSDIE